MKTENKITVTGKIPVTREPRTAIGRPRQR